MSSSIEERVMWQEEQLNPIVHPIVACPRRPEYVFWVLGINAALCASQVAAEQAAQGQARAEVPVGSMVWSDLVIIR